MDVEQAEPPLHRRSRQTNLSCASCNLAPGMQPRWREPRRGHSFSKKRVLRSNGYEILCARGQTNDLNKSKNEKLGNIVTGGKTAKLEMAVPLGFLSEFLHSYSLHAFDGKLHGLRSISCWLSTGEGRYLKQAPMEFQKAVARFCSALPWLCRGELPEHDAWLKAAVKSLQATHPPCNVDLVPEFQALVLQAVRLLPHLLCDARVDQAYLDRLCSPEAHAVVLPLRALSVPEEQALRQLHDQFQAQKQERVQAQAGGTSDGHGLRNLHRPCKPVGAVRRGTRARALTLPRRHSQDDSSGSSTTPSPILSAPDGPPVLPQLLPLTDDMQPLLPDHGALAPSRFSAMRLTLDDLEFENEPFQQFSKKSQGLTQSEMAFFQERLAPASMYPAAAPSSAELPLRLRPRQYPRSVDGSQALQGPRPKAGHASPSGLQPLEPRPSNEKLQHILAAANLQAVQEAVHAEDDLLAGAWPEPQSPSSPMLVPDAQSAGFEVAQLLQQVNASKPAEPSQQAPCPMLPVSAGQASWPLSSAFATPDWQSRDASQPAAAVQAPSGPAGATHAFQSGQNITWSAAGMRARSFPVWAGQASRDEECGAHHPATAMRARSFPAVLPSQFQAQEPLLPEPHRAPTMPSNRPLSPTSCPRPVPSWGNMLSPIGSWDLLELIPSQDLLREVASRDLRGSKELRPRADRATQRMQVGDILMSEEPRADRHGHAPAPNLSLGSVEGALRAALADVPSLGLLPGIDSLELLRHIPSEQLSPFELLNEWHEGPVTAENAGERLIIRSERETLTRLPKTHAILSTIRTYRRPLSELQADPEQAARLAAAIRALPPDVQDYKGLKAVGQAALDYLDALKGS
ncbi:hypothetical protein WJX84_001345 [Apatococcus fuscideae]|uniref:Uncharacterized protein n=1 Tax=Apatococcus fuscideae TaxID=2026836 RepID=A0AAW1RUS2_9CHLO